MAWAFLHGKGFAAILPPLMTFGRSSQMASAGETSKLHTFTLDDVIFLETNLGYSSTFAVSSCSAACMGMRHGLTNIS